MTQRGMHTARETRGLKGRGAECLADLDATPDPAANHRYPLHSPHFLLSHVIHRHSQNPAVLARNSAAAGRTYLPTILVGSMAYQTMPTVHLPPNHGPISSTYLVRIYLLSDHPQQTSYQGRTNQE